MKADRQTTIQVINLEQGMPTAEVARKQLITMLERIKRQGGGLVKVIHGYGSSGQGGAIRLSVQKSMALRKESGWLRGYVPGEKWDIFHQEARDILDSFPEARKDKDLGKSNQGISMILI